jgi:hypothetical protein
MIQIEKIIVAGLGILCVSLLIYIMGSWTSQTTPSTVAPAARAAQQSAETGKCDSADTIATLKSMALQKINGQGSDYFIPYRNWYLSDSRSRENPGEYLFILENVSVDSFRRRGSIGDAGLSCAALINVHPVREKSRDVSPAKISAEYTIEPTTDGKTIVSVRFQPSS